MIPDNFSALPQQYQTYISTWQKLANRSEWPAFTSHFLFESKYIISKAHYTMIGDVLQTCRADFFKIKKVDGAFLAYCTCLSDFFARYIRGITKLDGDSYALQNVPDGEAVDLKNLIAELTRCSNLLIDRIDQYLVPGFRYLNGYVFLAEDAESSQYILHYPEAFSNLDAPYTDLAKFKKDLEAGEFEFSYTA